MGSAMHSWYLLAEFDAASQRRLRDLWETLLDHGFDDQQTPGLPPHITLRGLPDGHRIDLDAKLAHQPAIDVRLGHLGLFGQAVLFVAPNVNEDLLALYRRLAPEDSRACHDWVPHVTMLIDTPPHIGKALPILAQGFVPFDARVVRVCLYQMNPVRRVKAWDLR